MRVLHMFPTFGADLPTGSEQYTYHLSRRLVEQGVAVDVLATCSRQLQLTSLFSMQWRNDYASATTLEGGVHIRRFPVTVRVPRLLGGLISFLIQKRWQKETGRNGPPQFTGPAREHYRRALKRPSLYHWLGLAGLGPWSAPLLLRLAQTIAHYDLVLVGISPLALIWQVTQVARHAHTPLIILPFFHPDDLYHYSIPLFQCYKNADALLMQTSYSTSLFQEWFPSSWPVEIGAGVDQAELTNGRISGERFRLKHGLTSRHIVLFVGRKESGKRYDLALAAVEALNDPNTILVMIGADVDGKRLPSSSVLYLGSLPRDELLDAYDACDVFVMPSESESFGLVFLEAWMRRKPVIGNANCGPVAALINDEDDGFLCETIEEIITRLRQLFQNPVRAEQMGNTGYTKVIQRYTWAIVGQKAYQLYSQIAERRLTSA